MLTFRDIETAQWLLSEVAKADGLLADENCGLLTVGPYRDRFVVGRVMPAYRQALVEYRAELARQLTELGVDPNSARSWAVKPDNAETANAT